MIYDISGRLVKSFSTPVVGVQSAVTWVGDDDIGRKLPSGVYFVSLEADGRTEIVKTVYVR
jgi:flagellar hook assembly protein FlgD